MVNQMGYGGDRGEIYEMDHNLTIKDSEFIATYGGTFLTWGKEYQEIRLKMFTSK